MTDLVYDHLGNSFSTLKTMCAEYNISIATYYKRLKQGMSLNDILTTPTKYGSICIEYNGKVYSSIENLCRELNIDRGRFSSRYYAGWKIEDCIEKPVDISHSGSYRPDFLLNTGKTREEIAELCNLHNINYSTLYSRLKSGMSLQDALNKPVIRQNRHSVIDHTGREHKSVRAMCKYWGIERHIYVSRIKSGKYTLKEILESSDKKIEMPINIKLGYDSIQELCKTYGISTTTYYRRVNTLKMEPLDALTVDLRKNRYGCKDHLGNEYRSKKEMCDKYNIEVSIFSTRIKNGYTVEEALTLPVNKSIHDNNMLLRTLIAYGVPYIWLSAHFNNTVKRYTVIKRLQNPRLNKLDLEIIVSIQIIQHITLAFIGLDGQARYKVPWHKDYQTTRQIIAYKCPDLLDLYDKAHPKGEWNPYKGANKT